MPRGNRNPYEIRFDTLQLAQSILSENAAARRDANRDIREDIIQGPNNPDTNENGEAGLYDPHTYTTQDVINEARALYEFIDPVAKEPVQDVSTKNPEPVLGNAPSVASLPGDGLPAPTGHPDAGKRRTVLNNSDLHVSVSSTPPGRDATVYVWFNDHLYKGRLIAASTKRAEVHGIFPHISAPPILNRIEAALTKYLRGTKVKLRYHDETEFPPLKGTPNDTPTTYEKTLDDGTKISLNIYSASISIDVHEPHACGQIYLARIRPTSSTTYLLIPEDSDAKDIAKLPSHVLDTVEQAVAEQLGQNTHVRFQGR